MTDKADVVIIGGGIAGLYMAKRLKEQDPTLSITILERNRTVGGRLKMIKFEGLEVTAGAGVGREAKDTLLIQLLKDLGIETRRFTSRINYSNLAYKANVTQIVSQLKRGYSKYLRTAPKTLKAYAESTIGSKGYQAFRVSTGYSDFDRTEAMEALKNYGFDDVIEGFKGLHVPWSQLVKRMCEWLKEHEVRIRTGCNVRDIRDINTGSIFKICYKRHEKQEHINARVVVTTLVVPDTLKLISRFTRIPYRSVIGNQAFIRVYARINERKVMASAVPYTTIVNGPLQKIIPINADKGVYMISYADNHNARVVNKHAHTYDLSFFEKELAKQLHINVTIRKLKYHFWSTGTHYYKPYIARITRYQLQHPYKGLYVIGESVSRHHGWTQGALESVEALIGLASNQLPGYLRKAILE